MSDAEAKVVSKSIRIVLDKPIPGKVIADAIIKVLTHLGQNLNYKGKIIGHIKAIAEAGEDYIQISLTNLPDVNIKASLAWEEKTYTTFSLIINIIVFGYEKSRLEKLLEEAIQLTPLFCNFTCRE